MRVDLNSDLGEGAGTDEEIMALVTSANVACGGHAGDEETMRQTVQLALRHRVAVGAHPGYPDRAGFGRTAIEMPPERLRGEIVRQVGALRAIADAAGAKIAHVKAHGALYNLGERDEGVAATLVEAVREVDEDLLLFAPAGSAMARAASRLGIRVAREGFADRAYEPDGTLRSRRLDGALVTDPRAAAEQAVSIARDRRVRTSDGGWLALEADTICLHGDTPGAAEIARKIHERFRMTGIRIAPLDVASAKREVGGAV